MRRVATGLLALTAFACGGTSPEDTTAAGTWVGTITTEGSVTTVVNAVPTRLTNAQQAAPSRSVQLFPSLIEGERGPDRPLWIEAALLMDVFGKLRRDYVPATIADYLEGKEDLIDEINDMSSGSLERDRPCVIRRAMSSSEWGFEAPSSLDELLAAATFAVGGYVEDSLGGFWRGEPATVITVRVTDLFKEHHDAEIPARINVPIFVGEVAIGSARICLSANGWSQAPMEGDEIFLFPRRELEPTHNLLMIDGNYDIIFSSNDELIVPRRLSESLELDEGQRSARFGAAALRQSLRAIRR